MDENLLKRLWVNANREQKVEIDAEKLITSINDQMLYMEKTIKKRDKIEIFVAVLMMLLFGCLLVVIPQVLAKIGAAILVVNCTLIIFKLIHARKVEIKQEAGSEIKYNLMISLQQVRQQITLLNTMLWWYLLPLFIGVLCFYYAISQSFISKVIYTIVVTVLYGYIWYLNKKAVREQLKPLEDGIIQALNELSE